jgi:MraZ protein
VVKYPNLNGSSGTNAMLLLTGEYQHVVDNKSRVLISNKLRSQIDVDEHGSNFYLVLGANGILCLYPEKYFEQIAFAATPGTTAPDEAVAFERISFAMSSKVELDGQGRLLLNEKLRKRAGLKDNITLIGVRDHIELWNTESWEQYISDHMAQYQKQMSQARQVVLQKQNNEC